METQSDQATTSRSLSQSGHWDLFRVFKRGWWAFLLGGLIVAPLLGLAIAFAAYYSGDKEYLGSVRLQISPSSGNYKKEYFEGNTTGETRSHTEIQTQFSIIKSKQTLYSVVEELQLVKRWEDVKSPADAYNKVLKMLDLEEVKGTDLIDINVYHTDPIEAAELANAIAEAYRDRRASEVQSRKSRALDMLNAQETLQEQKVEDARFRTVELMEKFQIVDLGPGWTKDADGFRQKVASSRMTTLQAEQEISALKTHIESLEGLTGDQLIEEAIALNVFDNTIAELFPEKSKLKAQLDGLQESGLGSTHPEVMRLNTQLIEVSVMLNRSAEEVKNSLQKRLEIATGSMEHLMAIEDEKRAEAMEERKQYTQYLEAKRAYETQNMILTDMRQALIKEKADLSMPLPHEIHEMATPSDNPARPDISLYLAVGFFGGGLMLFIPIGLAFMYLSHAFLRP